MNQIKHNSPSSVLSQYNPIASLKPSTRKKVNELFLTPLLTSFFSNKGGIEQYEELDPDKLFTEIEFVTIENFVKTYIYKEIVTEIKKVGDNVIFKPKYVISYDYDLTDYEEENNIRFGAIRLGEAPILYYIYIDLQEMIRFIKSLPTEPIENEISEKIFETEKEKRNRLFDTVIFQKSQLLDNTQNPQKRGDIKREIDSLKNNKTQIFEGKSRKLRVNLSWNTTDDLDLHIITPNGEIAYNTPNKTIEYKGVFGVLDIDKNAGGNIVSNPQENINFDSLPFGPHKIYVRFYTQREKNEVPFIITIIPEFGEGRIYSRTIKGKDSMVNVATFEQKNGVLEFQELS